VHQQLGECFSAFVLGAPRKSVLHRVNSLLDDVKATCRVVQDDRWRADDLVLLVARYFVLARGSGGFQLRKRR
jgi:hypothetical protein